MRIDVVTIFPEYLAPLDLSLIGRARAAGILDVAVHDLRTWTTDRHRTVDDAPLGGGAGMVMRPEPWGAALDAVLAAGRERLGDPDAVPHLLVPSPAGTPLTQAGAEALAREPWLAFACGRYEGIDERVLEEAATRMPVTPLSLGDYVLGGGEVAVLVVVEAVARLLPGVVGNPHSLVEESHAPASGGLLEPPVYTRPASWRGREAPPVLLSGHHARVARWRRDEQLRRTAARRPDLLARLRPQDLDAADLAVLAQEGWSVRDGALVPASPAPVRH
ncbi:tRNA (guanosine(37)-N1)-methyltransferase TrmD [Quadrisphaera sp. DSM 44207]|uniref:tRNA (guanosine(37)-N1)-methyltransferase TrmD n=1 Tax=Quadrisphaera sp. DSM 44207 TaxID=1881057 RepID=UPI0008924462|nr:tRNA (guanosine(37)-N1)-methyltransferase TrmD [Quadrisphaera sp. DSM 44207]SDQ75971.1 tRNA (Guanine37-N(1)-) methyltransferase [Quadrisphaera sp. DSM 44207]